MVPAALTNRDLPEPAKRSSEASKKHGMIFADIGVVGSIIVVFDDL